MQLGLRAKLTMVMTGLVLLSSLVLSLVFLELLMQQVLHDTDKRANELAREVFDTAKRALDDAKAQGVLPASIRRKRTITCSGHSRSAKG
jgi:HD-like signal output (HDOD) protein